jgi:hypothetical protein
LPSCPLGLYRGIRAARQWAFRTEMPFRLEAIVEKMLLQGNLKIDHRIQKSF